MPKAEVNPNLSRGGTDDSVNVESGMPADGRSTVVEGLMMMMMFVLLLLCREWVG